MNDSSQRRANHREGEIVEVLRRAGGASRIAAIASTLDVSEETVRRNIRRLSDDGVVEKLHGGAHLLDADIESGFWQRMDENPGPKRRIAACVAEMIGDGASLFLDVGSTTAFIAEALRGHRRLLVVTNSVVVAHKLATRNDNRVFMAGGELRAHDGGAFGADALAFVNQFRVEYAILSAAAINAQNGFMLYDLEEAEFSRTIMSRAAHRIIAADASKFGRSAPISVGNPGDVDVLVTDTAPPAPLTQAAREWSVEVVLAGTTA